VRRHGGGRTPAEPQFHRGRQAAFDAPHLGGSSALIVIIRQGEADDGGAGAPRRCSDSLSRQIRTHVAEGEPGIGNQQRRKQQGQLVSLASRSCEQDQGLTHGGARAQEPSQEVAQTAGE